MPFGEPVAHPTLGLAEKINTAFIGQQPKVTDEIGKGVRINSAAISLKGRKCLGCRSDMFGFIDHARRISSPIFSSSSSFDSRRSRRISISRGRGSTSMLAKALVIACPSSWSCLTSSWTRSVTDCESSQTLSLLATKVAALKNVPVERRQKPK